MRLGMSIGTHDYIILLYEIIPNWDEKMKLWLLDDGQDVPFVGRVSCIYLE